MLRAAGRPVLFEAVLGARATVDDDVQTPADSRVSPCIRRRCFVVSRTVDCDFKVQCAAGAARCSSRSSDIGLSAEQEFSDLVSAGIALFFTLSMLIFEFLL